MQRKWPAAYQEEFHYEVYASVLAYVREIYRNSTKIGGSFEYTKGT
jgi:hypothetical protein